MHFTSLLCYEMATNCSGEVSCILKRKKTRRGKRWRNLRVEHKLTDSYLKQRKHRAAPWNTTQFLMEDREKVEPILDLSPTTSQSSRSTPEGNVELEFDLTIKEEADHFDEQFFVKDFEATYRQLYRENLYSLSKPELLEKVKNLENQRDVLEKEWRYCCFGVERKTNKLSSDSLAREFKQLQEQNDLLRKENELLRETKEKEREFVTDP